MADLAALAVDASVKMTVLGTLAWLGTRRAGLARARGAHAAWLAVLALSAALPVLALWIAPSTAIVPSRVLSGAVPSPGPAAAAWLLAAYLAGAAVLVWRLACGAWQIHRLRRESRAVVARDRREAGLLEACAARGAVLRETGGVFVPATAGAWRPVVFLPRGWRALDPDVAAAIVRHELAHVGRRAYAIAIGAEIVKAAFWFHPVAWIACARLRWFEELACDRAAAVGDPLRYARALLAVARLAVHPPPPLALSGASQLGRRVDLLMATRAVAGGWVIAAVAGAIAVVPLLPFVSFRLSAVARAAPPDGHAAMHSPRHGAHQHE